MNKLVLSAVVAAGAIAAPASAVTYNIATFGGQFSYGQYDTVTDSFTIFSGSCGFGTPCVSGPQGGAQVVYQAIGQLIAHPGTNALANTAVIFTAPTSSTYRILGSATLADTRAEAVAGDGVTLSGYFNGAIVGAASLVGPGSTLGFPSTDVFLSAGQQVALIITPNGNNAYDTVGLVGTIEAIPEPATWAMMIVGFGLIGGAMRRKPRVSVSYA